MKKELFKLVLKETGETDWTGNAFDAGDACERAFYDEEPLWGRIYEIYRAGKVKLTSSIKTAGWVFVGNYRPER